jgi:hypothetical protein
VSPLTRSLHKADANEQAPSYIKSGSRTVNIGSEEKDFGSESVYDKDSNSIQYTTVAKFPPVKLLPNSERKRILSEFTPLIVVRRDADSQSLVVPVSWDLTWLID